MEFLAGWLNSASQLDKLCQEILDYLNVNLDNQTILEKLAFVKALNIYTLLVSDQISEQVKQVSFMLVRVVMSAILFIKYKTESTEVPRKIQYVLSQHLHDDIAFNISRYIEVPDFSSKHQDLVKDVTKFVEYVGLQIPPEVYSLIQVN